MPIVMLNVPAIHPNLVPYIKMPSLFIGVYLVEELKWLTIEGNKTWNQTQNHFD